jgi:CcmD family protein
MMLALFFLLSTPLQGAVGNVNRFNGYLVLGYAVMWLVAVVYLVNLANKQRNLHQDIKLMQRLLEEDESDDRM